MMLIIFLPFNIGCWSVSDDNPSDPTPVTYNIKTHLPDEIVAPSMRAQATENWTLFISTIPFEFVKSDYDSDSKQYTLTFSKELTAQQLSAITNRDITLTLTSPMQQEIKADINLGTITNLQIRVTNELEVFITTAQNPTAIDWEPAKQSGYDSPDFYTVKAITYNGIAVSYSDITPTVVSTTTPSFEVEFNTPVTDSDTLKWELHFERLQENQSEGLTITDLSTAQPISIDTTATATIVNISVNEHTSYELRSGERYSIEIREATIGTGENAKRLTTPRKRYIQVQ